VRETWQSVSRIGEYGTGIDFHQVVPPLDEFRLVTHRTALKRAGESEYRVLEVDRIFGSRKLLAVPINLYKERANQFKLNGGGEGVEPLYDSALFATRHSQWVILPADSQR
jgi:hypothetical protein